MELRCLFAYGKVKIDLFILQGVVNLNAGCHEISQIEFVNKLVDFPPENGRDIEAEHVSVSVRNMGCFCGWENDGLIAKRPHF